MARREEYQEEQQPHLTGERHEERYEKGKVIMREDRRGGKSVKKGDSKFIEKKPADYPNRYKGELAPKKDVVQECVPGNYKDNRYK